MKVNGHEGAAPTTLRVDDAGWVPAPKVAAAPAARRFVLTHGSFTLPSLHERSSVR